MLQMRETILAGCCVGSMTEVTTIEAGGDAQGLGSVPPRHDGQDVKMTPPVLPDESSVRRENILLSERQKL
jgi:hypothetical protein